MKICLQAICILAFTTPTFAQSSAPARRLLVVEPGAWRRNLEGEWEEREGNTRHQPDIESLRLTNTSLENIPSISPLEAGESPWISSFFGMRLHPIDGVYKPHLGLDLVCRRGFQFVYATANGQVTWVGERGGLGLAIEVSHANGYNTGYGHLGAVYVRQGDQVKIGEVLGVMGSSGKATGIHLHYTVNSNGVAVDPLPYLTLYEQIINKKDAFRASLTKNEVK